MLNFNTLLYNENTRAVNAFIESNTSYYLYKQIQAKDLTVNVSFIHSLEYLKLRLEQCKGQSLVLEELQESKIYVKVYSYIKDILNDAEKKTEKFMQTEKARSQQIA